MPIASMLEADKPFMFATSSTGRPATAADLAASSSAPKPISSTSMTSSDALPAYSRPLQPPSAPHASSSQSYTPPPPAPPPPQPPASSSSSTTTGPPTTSYYHARNERPPPPPPPPSHQHHPPVPAQNDDPFLYQHHHAPLPFARPPIEQDDAYAYRSNGSSHIAGVYAQRRVQQPHLHQQYHHHLPHSLPPSQSVIDEHYTPAAAGAPGPSAAVPPPPPLSGSTIAYYEADDSDAWLVEGNYEADNRRYKKRRELSGRLEKIDMDFMANRERIYAEKLSTLQDEIRQVHEDTHAGYLQGLDELKYIREKRIQDGRLFRAYQERIIDNQFHREKMQAEEECSTEKQEMREKLFAALEEKRRKLKEDKDNCELAYDSLLESQTRMMKRNLRRRGMEQVENKANKRKQLSGPALVFKLKDDDLQTDLAGMHIDPTPFNNKKSSSNNKKK